MKSRVLYLIIVIFFIQFNNLISSSINKIVLAGNNITKDKTIYKIINEKGLYEKKSMIELDNLIKRIKKKLEQSLYFEQVVVTKIQSKKSKDKIKLIISLKEKQILNIGGDNAYGYFGRINMFGNSEYFKFELGYNRQNLNFGYEFLTKSLYFDLNIGNINNHYDVIEKEKLVENKTQEIGLETMVGFRLNFNSFLELSNKVKSIKSNDYNFVGKVHSLEIKYRFDSRNKITNLRNLRENYFSIGNEYFLNNKINHINLELINYIPINNKIYIAIKNRNSYLSGNEIRDFLKLSLNSIDGIKSKDNSKLLGNINIESHFELRYLSNDFLLLIAESRLETFVFYEIGRAFNNIKEINGEDLVSVYGLGLTVLVGEPINVPLRFAVGQDNVGNNSFYFDVSVTF